MNFPNVFNNLPNSDTVSPRNPFKGTLDSFETGLKQLMDRPTKIIIAGMSTGILLFLVFTLFTMMGYAVYSIALNNFMSMIGVLLAFISGFFFISMRTLK